MERILLGKQFDFDVNIFISMSMIPFFSNIDKASTERTLAGNRV